MSFVSIKLTTKSLIRALQWQRMEAEEKVFPTNKRKKTTLKSAAK